MNKIKNNNVFWFVIDSVRTFKTGRDDRDRLDVMDIFAQDAIEFTNCFTSAPSSLLAAGAMFSGLPSIYISRHYNDWKFKNTSLTTLANLAKEYHYKIFPLLNSRDERERLQFLLPPFSTKELPRSKKLYNYGWQNEDITNIFDHILKVNHNNVPYCYIFWYDCRRDRNISKHVERALEIIKAQGLYDESIIIMNSDHGYPDPDTKLNEEFFRDLGHDMVLTDDNIKVPLLLKYPGCGAGQKIGNVVGLTDVLPTILDILKIPENESKIKFKGKSLLPVIIGTETEDKRIIRTDTRLSMDVGKVTSLRNKEFKYIYFYDDNYEVLFDLKNDPKELNNVLENSNGTSNKILGEFRMILNEYENELFNYHKEELLKNAERSFSEYTKKYNDNNLRLLIITQSDLRLLKILYHFLRDKFNSIEIEFLYYGNQKINKIFTDKIYNIKSLDPKSIINLTLKSYSIIIYLTHNSRRVFLKDNIIKSIKSISSKEYLLMNYNFELFNYFTFKSILSYIKIFFDWEMKGFFYKEEPLYFFKDLLFYLKMTFKKVILRRKEQFDLLAAREILEYRKFQLEGIKKGLQSMEDRQMEYEFDRIKTRE